VSPNLGLMPRVVLASLPAFAVLFLPVPWFVQGALSIGVFIAALAALRAVPLELLKAFLPS
jgi:hypothetical protein